MLRRGCTGIRSSELILGLRFKGPLRARLGREALHESAMLFVQVHRGKARANDVSVRAVLKGNERGGAVMEEENHGGNEIDWDDDDGGSGNSDGDDDDVGDEDEDCRE
ncbi:hypothetical protein Scep_002049 [Stephania cephalantha]|uniref:Uncharacterized protein n=1 Tax=Stephania cephalantha TaxID=152367 RepID=A0AAP0L9B5_9MAGN